MCQHEKIETNPICNCDSNIAFIYYWWNAGTASSTAFRLVITNRSGYISQYQKYTSLLEKAGITYRTKARDLSSPSLFSMGTRERAGTAFQKINYQILYTIYVRKADYERAVHVILA